MRLGCSDVAVCSRSPLVFQSIKSSCACYFVAICLQECFVSVTAEPIAFRCSGISHGRTQDADLSGIDHIISGMVC